MQHSMGPLICSVSIFNFCINTQFLCVLFKLVGMKLRASGNPQDPLLLAAAAPTPILYCLLRAFLPVIRDFICIPYCVLQIAVNCNVSFFIQIYVFFSAINSLVLSYGSNRETLQSYLLDKSLSSETKLSSTVLPFSCSRKGRRFSEAVFKLLLGNLYPFWQWTIFFPSKATYMRRKRSNKGHTCKDPTQKVVLLGRSFIFERKCSSSMLLQLKTEHKCPQRAESTKF